jgi:hypothetical protein
MLQGGALTAKTEPLWRSTLAMLRDGQLVELTSMGKKQLAMLKEQGLIVNTREAKSYKIKMHLVSGADVLEDAYESECKWIPLVPVIGAEIPLDHGVYRHGLIRFQREPQQLHNYFLSVAAETLGQQPRAPWIGTLDGDGQNDPADIPALLTQLTNPEQPANLELLADSELLNSDGKNAKPEDLLIVVRAAKGTDAENALGKVDELLKQRRPAAASGFRGGRRA